MVTLTHLTTIGRVRSVGALFLIILNRDNFYVPDSVDRKTRKPPGFC